MRFFKCTLFCFLLCTICVTAKDPLRNFVERNTSEDESIAQGKLSPGSDSIAIVNAIVFLKSKINQVHPLVLLGLDYLDRKFGLALGIDQELLRSEIASGDYKVYLRILDPAIRANREDINALNDIDRMMGSALYCNSLTIPEDLISVLYRKTEADGYGLTHAAIAYQWLVENNCGINKEDSFQLKKHLSDELDKLITKNNTVSDLWVEGVAMMYYIGEGKKVKEEWIQKIIKAQQTSGGWGFDEGVEPSSDHTTCLALWSLCEWKYKNAPATSWIHR